MASHPYHYSQYQQQPPAYSQTPHYQQPSPYQQPPPPHYPPHQANDYPPQPQPYSAQGYQSHSAPPQQYSTYQQHSPYPAQPYPNQHYPQHQQYSPQNTAYQSSPPTFNQPQAPSNPPSQHAQAPAQACFNCGNQGHWAQDCPEPRREVPAGALNPEQHRRHGIAPHKRNHQIITKFAQHGGSNHGSPHGYGPYPAGNHQYPSPYTPGTPHSAASASSHQWPQHHQQQQQHPHHQANYQQYQHSGQQSTYYQPPQTPQNNYPTPATPGPAQSYGPPAAPPQVSSPNSQPGYDPQNPRAHFAQHPGWQKSPSQSDQQPKNGPSGAAASPSNTSQIQESGEIPSALQEPQPTSAQGEVEEGEDLEDEEDNLDLLDVPDLPVSTKEYGTDVVKPIAMPLPANAVVADALSPFERANPQEGDRCHSKYWRHAGEETLVQNIVDSAYWKDHNEDTIFLDIILTGETIPVEDCRSKIVERQRPREPTRDTRSMSHGAPQRKEVAECAESLEQLERALAAAKAKHAALVSKSEEKKRLRNEQQSPLRDDKRIKREDPAIKVEQRSPARRISLEAGSTKANESEDVSMPSGPSAPPARGTLQKSPADSDSTPTNRRNSRYNSNGAEYHYHRHEHPPPPPPLEERRSNAGSGSPPSAGLDHFGFPTNTDGASYFDHHMDQPNPFGRSRSDYQGSRKRNFESSSDESDTPKRQEDDVTPKLKRRQPKVAEAYSRRW